MPRPDTSKQRWIEKGYEYFAFNGPDKVSINKISKEIGSPRASFYHHFSDMEVFNNHLLHAHWQIIKSFVLQGKENCKQLIPDLYQLLAAYPLSLKFHRQLFLNRHNPSFGYLYIKAFDVTVSGFVLDLFVKQYDLKLKDEDANKLWFMMTESWYARINPNKLDAVELQRIAEEIMNSILKLMSSNLYDSLT